MGARSFAALALSAFVAGCASPEVGHDDYVEDNARAFRSVPPPPGGTLVREEVREHTEENHLYGWWTDREYRLNGPRPIHRAVSFYVRAFEDRGWTSDGHGPDWASYKQGDVYVHVFGFSKSAIRVSLDSHCC